MAQLKDLLVTGSTLLIGDLNTHVIKCSKDIQITPVISDISGGLDSVASAGTIANLSSCQDLKNYKNFIGTSCVGGTWNNLISVRHRNGCGDGRNFGIYLRTILGTDGNNLIFNSQAGGNWGTERTIIDSSNILSKVYPVGSIYMSVNNMSPASFIGGSWERIENVFLLGASNAEVPYPVGLVGGEASHLLTVEEMPSHNHSTSVRLSTGELTGSYGFSWTDGNWQGPYDGDRLTSVLHVNHNGSSWAHNNMPPYLAVYMWKRTA